MSSVEVEIVDVGASTLGRKHGPEYEVLLNAGLARLTGFEPNPDEFKRLKETERQRFLPYAVGDGRDAVLNVTAFPGFSSTLKPNAEYTRNVARFAEELQIKAQIPFATKRLDDMDEISRIDLLKIDIQGGECAVFENGQRLLSETLAVQTEVAFGPIYHNQPQFGDQDRILRQAGLMFLGFVAMNRHPVAGSPGGVPKALRKRDIGLAVDADALYVRDIGQWEDLPTDALLRLFTICVGTYPVASATLRLAHILQARGVPAVDLPRATEAFLLGGDVAKVAPHLPAPKPAAKPTTRRGSFKLHTLIRTHRYDADIASLVDRVSSEFDGPITLVCDETHGEIDTGPHAKIALTTDDLHRWKWPNVPHDWGWFCGDVCYYAAHAAKLPGTHYLLLENDVWPTPGAFRGLVDYLKDERPDAAAFDLNVVDSERRFSRALSQLGRPPGAGCIFPVTMMRKGLVPAMHDLRRASLETGDNRINDEAIFAAIALEDGVHAVNLAETCQHLFPRAAFVVSPPKLLEHERAIEAGTQAHFVHPALSFDAILNRVKSGEKSYGRQRLRKVLKQVDDAQRAQILAAIGEG